VTGRPRFGVVNETVLDGGAWRDHVRRVEDAGVDVFLVRDHFSAGAFGPQLAPFSALATAAALTTRLHVGTLVLSNDFRHPAIVAHEAASLHHLSGGRFELGVGAGWYEPEYAAAGMRFDAAGRRIGRLEESLDILRTLLAREPVHHSGESYQLDGLELDVVPGGAGTPPLLVGAGGPRMLRLAARYADIVGILPAPIKGSKDTDDPADRTPAAFDAKVAVLREAAGDRFDRLQLSAFVALRLTDNRRTATEKLIADRGWSGVSAEAVWEMPTILIGSATEIREGLEQRRERFGLSYVVTSDQDLPTLSKVLQGW
jgi:probable F420-dependent oxidoreductase